MGARASLRACLDAQAFAFGKVHDRMFSSEASPLCVLDSNKKELQDVKAVDMKTLQHMFGAALFVEYDQALFAATKLFLEMWKLEQFDVMNYTAHLCGGFTRHFYAEAYRKYKIPLPDVHQRARERGFQNADEDSSLLRQFHAVERELVEQAAKKFPTGPQLPKKLTAEQLQGLPSNSHSKALVDPNFVAIECRSTDSRWTPFREATNKAFDGIDENTAQALMSWAESTHMEIPLLEEQLEPRADTLQFKGLHSVWNEQKQDWDVTGQVLTRTTPILRFLPLASTEGSRGYLLIPVHFLMNPYHYVLQMFLTAHENPHTRQLRCVLPISLRGLPHLLHTHHVCKRMHHPLVLRNPRFVDQWMQKSTFTDMTKYNHVLPVQLGNQNNFTQLFQHNQDIRFDEDPELVAFATHLLQTNEMPRSITADDRSWNDPLKSPQERFIAMVRAHPARPGATEDMIEHRRREYLFFKEGETFTYPDAHAAVARENDYEDRAGAKCQLRSSSTALEPDERAQLFDVLDQLYNRRDPEERQLNQDMKDYARLSTLGHELNHSDKTDLEVFRKRFGAMDFVRILVKQQLKQEDRERDVERRRTIDTYTHQGIRARPVQELPEPPSGGFFLPQGNNALPGEAAASGRNKRSGSRLEVMANAARAGLNPMQALRRSESSMQGSSVPNSEGEDVSDTSSNLAASQVRPTHEDEFQDVCHVPFQRPDWRQQSPSVNTVPMQT
jgi:hypothetical protein